MGCVIRFVLLQVTLYKREREKLVNESFWGKVTHTRETQR